MEVVLVNDGSTEQFNADFNAQKKPLTIINLTINVGHQRAIAIGLSYVREQMQGFDAVIVMDSDGEDRASDIPALTAMGEKNALKKIIFAQRSKRNEGTGFKIFYFFYKSIFKLLTGQRINFGNFSFIPSVLLNKVVSIPSTWNHYSGSIVKSKIPFTTVPIDRGSRYHGSSKMNFVSLIIHGLSAISIYIEVVTVRLLIFSFVGILVSTLFIVGIFIIKLFTDFAIPGWASSMSLLIFNIIIQFTVVSLLILLLILYSRNNIQHSPNKYYKDFIDSIEKNG